MGPEKDADRRSERGTVTVFAALAAAALLLFAALTIDVGAVLSSRTQSQSAGDAAALAAAAKMIDSSGGLALDAAKDEAIAYAAANSTLANPSVTIRRDEDIIFGNWDLCASPPSLDTSVDTSDPNLVTAVRVDVHMDGAVNKQSPVFLSRLIGRDGFVVNSSAVAYLGFEGSFPPFDLDVPLAICDPSACCATDFCNTYADPVANPPNGCVGDPALSCLDPLASNPLACWTAFADTVNTTNLMILINNGNPSLLDVGDPISVDSGGGVVTLEVIDALHAKLAAVGGSWVVKLPVVQCQGGNPCASGSLPIRGSACFEIKQVKDPGPPPSLDIRGRFLCSDAPNFGACRDTSGPPHETGGCPYGVRSVQAVLVD